MCTFRSMIREVILDISVTRVDKTITIITLELQNYRITESLTRIISIAE